MTRPRVVITGVAGVTPLANDIETTWKRLLAGESGIAPITLFDASAYDSRIAGEVKNFVPENYMPPKQVRRMDRFTQFAVASAKMLLQDAGFEVTEANAYDVAVILGVGLGGLHTLETYHTKLLEAVLERLRQALEVEQDFMKGVMERAGKLTEDVNELVEGCNESLTNVLTSAPPAMA